jgi:hypothetical protein
MQMDTRLLPGNNACQRSLSARDFINREDDAPALRCQAAHFIEVRCAQQRAAGFFPLSREFNRAGKPSSVRVVASSCQISPFAANRSFR